MNCKKFTPGPWEVVGHQIEAVGKFQDRRCTGYGCNNNFICDLDDGEYHEYSDEEECAANAALIASAPDMYRVLSGICWEKSAQCCNYAPESCKVCSIRKALEKARGEA